MITAKAANRKDLSGKPATTTHQHYRFIAQIIRNLDIPVMNESGITGHCGRHYVGRVELAEAFGNALAETNPNFDNDRFERACLDPSEA